MIYYLVTAEHRYTIETFLDSPLGEPLGKLIKVIPYEHRQLQDIRDGIVIFSDIERLDSKQRLDMSSLCESLKNSRGIRQILNHPGQSWRRFELLSNLHAAAINDFNVWRLKDILFNDSCAAELKLPVFIRNENDHMGPGSKIINSRAGLWLHALKQVRKSGRLSDKIATGFLDTSDEQGIFRKYSAFRIGASIIPRHIFFSRNWAIKEADLTEPALIEEELAYVDCNPHRKELMKIFEMANIGYGRIDYGIKDGRIEVWEINTNPMLLSLNSHSIPERRHVHELFAERFAAVLKSLVMEPIIRKMREEDMDEVLKILAVWNMLPMIPTPEIPVSEHDVLTIGTSFVAELEGKIVGVCSYRFMSDIKAETLSLAMDPQYRGAGIGYRLQSARLQEMHSRGVRYVHTDADRPETIEWYKKKFGYTENGKKIKKHNFSLDDVDYWTVLELDLDKYFSGR
jgi:N-acetylglutamate synthase-like GNAT family acetyltransferase